MATKKDNVPVLFIETVEQGDSGFYLDGTRGTSYEQQLRTPTVSWIPTEGIEVVEEEVEENGKKIVRKKNQKIRHIKDCDTIYPELQDKRGFKPNRMNDKIPMDNGFATVRAEGSTLNTYNYLKAATYFLDNPLRPESATPLYREVKVKEKAVELLDEDEFLTAAKSKVYALRINTGKKGDYKYNEEKIDSYCNLLNISDESPEQKLVALLQKAVTNPKGFLQVIVKAEQTIVTEISHALQLKVIKFEGKNAQYVDGKKAITALNVEGTKISQDKLVDALADYFATPEANAAYEEFKIKLDVAKEEQFSN